MHVIRTQAYQAHPVPSHVYYPPEDPLEPEVTRQSSIYAEKFEEQQEERIFRCKTCREVMYESDIDEHECEE